MIRCAATSQTHGMALPPDAVHAGGKPTKLGALICFEILHPPEVRRLVLAGAAVLVNITNDAWFGRSNMPSRHLGLSVIRAVELRRSVVRSANTGISALVDPLGNVIGRTPYHPRSTRSAE